MRAHARVGVPASRDRLAEETGLPVTWEHFPKRRDKGGVGGTVFSPLRSPSERGSPSSVLTAPAAQ